MALHVLRYALNDILQKQSWLTKNRRPRRAPILQATRKPFTWQCGTPNDVSRSSGTKSSLRKQFAGLNSGPCAGVSQSLTRKPTNHGFQKSSQSLQGPHHKPLALYCDYVKKRPFLSKIFRRHRCCSHNRREANGLHREKESTLWPQSFFVLSPACLSFALQ
jgi:hypothetical protein